MGKRGTKEQIRRLLREADQDSARGLAVADVCRKGGRSRSAFRCFVKAGFGPWPSVRMAKRL